MSKKPTSRGAHSTRKTGKKARKKRARTAPKFAAAGERSSGVDVAHIMRQIIDHAERRVPEAETIEGLAPGKVGPEIPIDAASVQRLFTAVSTEGDQTIQIWNKDGNELLVHAAKIRVQLDDGLIVVVIPVFCDQTGDAEIRVPFAVGGRNQPTGMLAATEDRPRGASQIVDIWAESLTAFAWRIIMAVTARAAFFAGVDQDREGLIPAALTAGREGLRILTMARHGFDRVIK